MKLNRIAQSGVLAGFFFLGIITGAPAEPPTVDAARAALQKAAAFFRTQVAVQGGYLWQYSTDLSRREGEGAADANTAWVQPPGTPSVGEALLYAYQMTGDRYYLEAAQETAHALLMGQLTSGGWDYKIVFTPAQRIHCAYRADGRATGVINMSMLDDNTTQSALSFLIRMDKTLEEKDTAIHESVLYALDSLMKVQRPNGGWPQGFSEPPNPDDYPVQPARYPASWPRKFPDKNYRACYTFNDNAMADTLNVMLLAWHAYQDPRYQASAERCGDFIIAAQMPDPQPAWAQQYNAQMEPVWARKFEPPAITGGESQGILRILMTLYRETGQARFLDPIPRAIAYLRNSLLPDGQLARFYELQTNTPLYFTKSYALTNSDADMPTHYCFKSGSGLDGLEAEYKALREAKEPPSPEQKWSLLPPTPGKPTPDAMTHVQQIITALDDRGAWVEDGKLRYQDAKDDTTRIIRSQTFADNVRALATFIAGSQTP